MPRAPYRSFRAMFWIAGNGASNQELPYRLLVTRGKCYRGACE